MPGSVLFGVGERRGLAGNMLLLSACDVFMVLKMLSPLEGSNVINFFIDLQMGLSTDFLDF